MAIKFTLIVFLLFGLTAIDEWIENKYKITMRQGFCKRSVNRFHKWLERILLAMFILFVIISHKPEN